MEYKITGVKVLEAGIGFVSRLGVGNGFVELGDTSSVTNHECCTGVDDSLNTLKDLLSIDESGFHVEQPEALNNEKSGK
jgi:hypothetical protein